MATQPSKKRRGMTSTARRVHLDLDAAVTETAREPVVVRFSGTDYTLPHELPADVLLPLIDPRLDLVGTLTQMYTADLDDDTTVDQIVERLLGRPDLPMQVWEAFNESLRRLFGDTQFDTFTKARPSVQAYVRLVAGLFGVYGVSLGEASEPSTTSTTGGGSSKPTSSDTTD